MSLQLSRTAKETSPSISLTPLIDVIFQLLVFFMLTSSFINPAIQLDLPNSDATTADIKEREVVISLKEDGSIFLNTMKISFDNLQYLIENRIKTTDNRTVFLKADKKVAYENFFKIMQAATKAGATDFQLVYKKEKD